MRTEYKEYKIEKGIPIPNRSNKGVRSKYRLDEMAVGDSILIAKENRNSVTSSWIRYAPKRFTSMTDTKDKTMVRVWRVK